MVRNKTKWRFSFLFSILVLNVFTKSLPIDTKVPSLIVSDSTFHNFEVPRIDLNKLVSENNVVKSTTAQNIKPCNETVLTEDNGFAAAVNGSTRNRTRSLVRTVRPGQIVDNYAVEISFNGDDTFNGRVVIDVRLEMATRNDPMIFHVEDLDIQQVLVGRLTVASATPADEITFQQGTVNIRTNQVANSYIVIIEYSGQISNTGYGIFQGSFGDQQYVGMNLYPTHARRVFPCMDELQAFTTISFTFNNAPFGNVVSNSVVETNSTQFRALQVPPFLWGMVSHDFTSLAIPAPNVILYGRSGLNQDALAGVAINNFINSYNQWMSRNYFEINVNQDGRLNIFALPDINVEWNALSTICIWEPYILMRNYHAVMQRKTSLVTIAEAMARQWFGYVVYPEDWRDQWVIQGLASYAAYEVVTEFQQSDNEDITLLDMNTIFVTDVIQEALLRDSYASALILYPDNNVVNEEQVRIHNSGLLKYKAPAIMHMLELITGDGENDYIQQAGQLLINRRTQTPISMFDFYDAVAGAIAPDPLPIGNIEQYLNPWVTRRGYPILHVAWRSANAVFLTQEHFSFTSTEQVSYRIPVTFTTNLVSNYDNVRPVLMMDSTVQLALPQTLGDDDYVIFNIQGRGYYRVNYDPEHWDRIIAALDDPDRRQDIHPLNRATLLDDALNLARAGRLDYDIALRLALTWQHETDYAPWKAFVRSMSFLMRRLESRDEDEMDDLYLRMIRRTIGAFEEEISFSPSPLLTEPAMSSLARGIVMAHACHAGYESCVTAANDWFYDPNSSQPTVNPNIPPDLRPAVFCTMVREAGGEATDLLEDYLETDLTLWERLDVLKSFACSQNEGFVNGLLMDTISQNSPYSVEERFTILAALIESGSDNLRRTINFMRLQTSDVRDMCGGPQKLEQLLYLIGENIPNGDLEFDFRIWVQSNNNNLGDSVAAALQALAMATENLDWDSAFRDFVFEWIDENGAHTVAVSFTLILFAALFTLFNS